MQIAVQCWSSQGGAGTFERRRESSSLCSSIANTLQTCAVYRGCDDPCHAARPGIAAASHKRRTGSEGQRTSFLWCFMPPSPPFYCLVGEFSPADSKKKSTRQRHLPVRRCPNYSLLLHTPSRSSRCDLKEKMRSVAPRLPCRVPGTRTMPDAESKSMLASVLVRDRPLLRRNPQLQ